MFFKLQKALTFDIYKKIDLYEFVKLCQFIDQILRDVNIKFRNVKEEYEEDYEESILRENFNNQKSSHEQSNAFRFRFETFKSNQKSNNQKMNQVLEFEQVNAFICYNCDKFNHIARRCSALRKMNLNNFVREIEKDISEQNVESKKINLCHSRDRDK